MFATANRLLERAGSEIGFRARAVPSGLSIPSDVDEVSLLLRRGEIGAAELLDRFAI
jgi:hypothetical protein